MQPADPPTRHVVVMGVSGCGKSTVALGVAERLGLVFAEADEFHPASNVEKMAAGIPLDDADRMPWLRALAAWAGEQAARGRSTVMACSSLRRRYRDVLRGGADGTVFIHLDGPVEVIAERLAARRGHFMPPALLTSQEAVLEPLRPDEEGVVLDLRHDPDVLVSQAVEWLSTGLPAKG